MPKVALPPGVTDEDYVLALLRATGVLCVYGSGFGTKPEDGFFRVVFLASPAELVGHLRPRRRVHRASSCARPDGATDTLAGRPLTSRARRRHDPDRTSR